MQSTTMADMGKRSVTVAQMAGSDEPVNIWKSILANATKSNMLLDAADIIVIGNGNTPQSVTLGLQQVGDIPEEERLGAGNVNNDIFVVDFGHVDIRDRGAGGAAKDSQSSSFWLINDSSRKEIFLTQLRRRSLRTSHMAALLCIDLDEPWSVLEQAKAHLSLLEEVLSSLVFVDSREDASNALDIFMRNAAKTYDTKEPAEHVEKNLGIPIVFVVCHAETAPAIVENKKVVGWMDAIQLYLRQFILETGGALVFANSWKKKNFNDLFDYLGHRLFGYDFSRAPELSVCDEIFIPAGYDSNFRILADAKDTIAEGLTKDFDQIVSKSKLINTATGAMDDQPQTVTDSANTFLARAMKDLGAGAAPGRGSVSVGVFSRLVCLIRYMLPFGIH